MHSRSGSVCRLNVSVRASASAGAGDAWHPCCSGASDKEHHPRGLCERRPLRHAARSDFKNQRIRLRLERGGVHAISRASCRSPGRE
eukprot:4180014-Pleurochrysis_carterae.AAC.1